MVVSTKYTKYRTGLRRRISRYPMSQRRTIRTQLGNPTVNIRGKYSNLMRYASKAKIKPITKVKKPWYRRYRPGKRARAGIRKAVGSKVVRGGVTAAAALGIAAIMVPKDIINNVAETVQNTAENIFEAAKGLTGALGSMVRAVGTSADAMSNGLDWLSDNLTTVAVVGGGIVVVDRLTKE